MNHNTHNLSDHDQLEDKVMKTATQYFGEELLPYLGITKKIRRIAPTEIIHLSAKRLHEDFEFEMEDGSLSHFEFESDAIHLRDLKRFREYEAIVSRQYDTAVITYVICSAAEENLKSEFFEGINTYRVKVIRLKDDNADEILNTVRKKKDANQLVEKEEVIKMVLTPLMSGTTTEKERILQALDLLNYSQNIMTEIEYEKVLAMLYAFSAKFLNNDDLKEVKGVLGMTRLGQMIWDDGLERGLEQGVLQATCDAIAKMLKKLTPEEIIELGYEQALVDEVMASMTQNA